MADVVQPKCPLGDVRETDLVIGSIAALGSRP